IHGPQYTLDGQEPDIRASLDASGNTVSIYDVEISPGANDIAKFLLGAGKSTDILYSVPRSAFLKKDLAQLFERVSSGNHFTTTNRSAIATPAESVAAQSNNESLCVNALWARDRVQSLLADGHLLEAQRVGSQYHIVTPVTGAVVLENAGQYRNFQ